jgi:hypothetical protein
LRDLSDLKRWPEDMSDIDSDYLNEAAELFASQSGSKASGASDDVAARIWDALDAGLTEELRGTAYWALGKRCRQEDKSRFVAALEREITRSHSTCYQILIALDNLGEPVFAPERSGSSVLEAEQNIADAKRYLAQAR